MHACICVCMYFLGNRCICMHTGLYVFMYVRMCGVMKKIPLSGSNI